MSRKTKTTATKEAAKVAGASSSKAWQKREQDTPATLVPKLRFPEFRDTDAWEPTTIGGLGRFYYGKSAPKWSLSVDAPTPCVRYGELYTKFGPVITKTYSRTDIDPETLRFSKGGEILIPRVGEKPEDFGKCCAYLPLKGIAIGEMISVLETKQHPLFYTYYFRNLYKQFAKVVEGQNVKNLYFAELEPLPIHRPSLPEQQKIAECLSSVDELIAAQARKLDALKTHKKGLMQQLFPREGETQPRLRFPDFQNAGEWEEKTLVDTCKMQAGKFVAAADIKEQNSGDLFPCYGGNGLRGFTATHTQDGVFPLIGRQGALCGNIKLATGRFHATEHAVVATPHRGVEVVWLYYLLDLLNLNRFATGQAQPGLSVDVLEKVPVTIPNDEREQQRIATCLSSLDALITAETQKHEALKTHKKGLMQQLFPSPEEVEA